MGHFLIRVYLLFKIEHSELVKNPSYKLYMRKFKQKP